MTNITIKLTEITEKIHINAPGEQSVGHTIRDCAAVHHLDIIFYTMAQNCNKTVQNSHQNAAFLPRMNNNSAATVQRDSFTKPTHSQQQNHRQTISLRF